MLDSEQRYRELLNEGARLGREQRFDECVAILEQAVALRRADGEGYFNLGVAYRSLDRLSDALPAFTKAVELRPDWAEACFNLANALRDIGSRDEALRAYRKAVAIRPDYVKALNNLGNLHLENGDSDRAEKVLRQALAAKADYPEGLFNLGRVLRRRRKFKEALEVTLRAAALQPKHFRYRLKAAELQVLAGDPAAAQALLAEVLQSDPFHPEAALQQATILKDQNKHAEALAVLDEVIRSDRGSYDIYWLRAEILRLERRFEAALADAREALRCNPRAPQAHNLCGVVEFALGRPAAAIDCYRRALELRPDLAEAHNNLGAALQAMRCYTESLSAFETALRLKPDFSIARLNRSLVLLREGRLDEGWREFEWRFLCPDYRLTACARPTWTGEPLAGKTILLRCEQGIGDTFQFLRYAALVKARGGRVLVECQEQACELATRCPGVDVVVKRGSIVPHYDVQAPLMSLPSIFGTTVETVPRTVPYLAPDPERVAFWRRNTAEIPGRMVGISWQGNRKFQADQLRSLNLAHFKALAAVPGITLVSLQKNDGVDQLQTDLGFNVVHFGDDLDRDGPFRDTAALMAACDLVVTSDTAVAHLAGALGRPVWVALSYAADWRWLADREDCPWYPTMRLFRQPTFQDWASVFRMIAAELSRETDFSRLRASS